MIVIGDIHGCFDTFMELLKQLPKDDSICLVGDLIDRGPKSKQVVDYVINSGMYCVMGNHEAMMMSWDRDRNSNDMLWLGNGGTQTLDSYFKKANEIGLKDDFDEKLFKEHQEWMKTLPPYIHFPHVQNEEGKSLVVSHSHISNMWNKIQQLEKDPDNNDKFLQRMYHKVTWGRPSNIQPAEGIYNIIGHTPQETVRMKSFYSNVDTGCFYKGAPGAYNHLTAVQYPTMKVWTQECIDEVKW